MMIPITRKEKYINEIVGGGNTAPGTPQTREELFFADILGEVVAPSPITRAEKYLAKIANKYNGELPEPVTRIERFLARAAGMDVAIPTPVTREEMFWANYALIVEKELNSIPPLTFNAVAGSLKNYRIYGNTENGQSVGDKTANFFNGSWQSGGINSDGYETANGKRVRSPLCNIVSQKTYTLNSNLYIATVYGFYSDGSTFIRKGLLYNSGTGSAPVTIDVPIDVNRIRVALKTPANTTITPSDVEWFMLNEGSTALPYEPYGYKIPVVVNEQTTNIYLDEPLAKSGENADYIDYETQKRHNSDGTESSVTLPEIIITAGTNTLTVGTEVQPSNVYIKYEGER